MGGESGWAGEMTPVRLPRVEIQMTQRVNIILLLFRELWMHL